MQKNEIKIRIFIFATLSVFAVMYFFHNTETKQEPKQIESIKKDQSVPTQKTNNNLSVGEQSLKSVDSSNKINVSFEISVEKIETKISEGSNVFDLLSLLQKNNQITFSAKSFEGLGYYIDSINSQKEIPKEGKYWTFFVNGKESNVGVSSYKLKNGDIISFKLFAK